MEEIVRVLYDEKTGEMEPRFSKYFLDIPRDIEAAIVVEVTKMFADTVKGYKATSSRSRGM